MSTRDILSIHFQGIDYTTYHQSESYPKELGLSIVQFAMNHLHNHESIHAFGQKIARLKWRRKARGGPAHRPQGGDLLTAIATGNLDRITCDRDLFRTGRDCDFAYILDLDRGVLDFWDLPERVESFPLVTISQGAVEVMDGAIRHLGCP